MGGGKSSPAPVDKSAKVTVNNEGVPNKQDPRGVPIAGPAPAATKSLLAPAEDNRKAGSMY